MDSPGNDDVYVVTEDDVRRIEAGERVAVAGYELTRDLMTAMTVHPYDYDDNGKLKEVAVPVVAEHLRRLVKKHRTNPATALIPVPLSPRDIARLSRARGDMQHVPGQSSRGTLLSA